VEDFKLKIVVLLASAALILTGCEDTFPIREVNQKERQRIFKECLAAVPKGPVVTGGENPWSDIISECEDAAYWQAMECVARCPGKKEEE
jgi:hypothetical protein